MKQVIKFIPFIAASFVIASCSNGTAHKVTLSSVNGEWRGATQAYEGVNYSATFIPETGYDLKGESLYVLVNNNRINDYTFYNNRLTILGSAITGDVKITANASAIEYEVNNNIDYATISSNKAYHNQTLALTIKASNYYILPETISVKVNDKELTSGYTYSPNLEENNLIIEGEYVTGTITLSGASEELMRVVFNSGSGSWVETGSTVTTKYAYVRKGETFAKAMAQISKPKAYLKINEFYYWTENDADPIDENTKIETYDFTVSAFYDKKILNVNAKSQSYQFDWKTILEGHETAKYGTTYELDIPLDKETSRTYFMPDDIYVAYHDDEQQKDIQLTKGQQYNLTIPEDKKSLKLTVSTAGTLGDLTINVNPYYNATITFDPNGGTWSDSETSSKTAVIKEAPEETKFNVLEAMRLKTKSDPTSPDIIYPTKADGKVFDGWHKYTIDPTTGKKIIDPEKVDVNAIVSDDMDLIAGYTDPTFETDTWENIITFANQGSDKLLEHYNKPSIGELISSTRNIIVGNATLGYVEQKLVVIGVDHDDLGTVDEHGEPTITGKATLTFMFQKVFAESVFDSSGSTRKFKNAWDGSTLKSGLVSTLASYVPDINPISNVLKKTYYNDTEQIVSGCKTTVESFFPFSQVELALTSQSGTDVKDEGNSYSYFADKGGSRKRESVLVDDSTYWLRSPYDIDTSNEYSYYIDEEGNVKHDHYDASHGILVGFCVGNTAI